MASIIDHLPIGKQHVVLVVLTLFLLRLWRRRGKRQLEDQLAAEKGCKPLRTWNAKWPLGLDLLLKAFQSAKREQVLKFFVSVVDASGTTFEQNLLGARGVGTTDPENIEAVLSKQFTDFGLGLRRPTFFPLLGDGIFTQDGAAWKHSRALVRPQFMQKRLEFEHFEQIKSCVEDLISCVPADGVIDLQPLFFRLTFDTTTFMLFGKSMSALTSEHSAGQESEFANAFNLAQDYLSHRGRLGEFYWLMSPKSFRDACKLCRGFVEDCVQKALETQSDEESEEPEQPNHSFLSSLIKETRDPRFLRDQCINVLIAGRDTTACLLSWTLRLLPRYPEVLDRLREEIKATVGLGDSASQPTRNDLKNMVYLNFVIKEVLRLYPPVPVNSRTAVKTTTLPTGGGEDGKSPILVRSGEAVGYCSYAMHRRKDLYGPDAEEFRPERWGEPAMKDIGWGYVPFNGGPRLCLGQDFAVMEAGYTIARLVQKFPLIDVPHGESRKAIGEEKQTLTLVMSSGEGCKVQLKAARS